MKAVKNSITVKKHTTVIKQKDLHYVRAAATSDLWYVFTFIHGTLTVENLGKPFTSEYDLYIWAGVQGYSRIFKHNGITTIFKKLVTSAEV